MQQQVDIAEQVTPVKVQVAQADPKTKKPHSTALADADTRLEAKKKKPGRPPTTTKDAVLALQRRTLGKNAGAILQRLVEGALDKTDPNHELCLRLAIERISPQRFWNNVSDGENGQQGGEGGNGGPLVRINIVWPDAKPVDTFDVQAVERTE